MRNKSLRFSLFALAAVFCLFAACSKEHQCKCELVDGYEDNTTLNIFYLDGSLDCEDITEMSFEEHTTSEEVPLEHVKIRNVKCRDYGN
ncbi:MAG: hypothetical protein ACSW8I_08255 [bacterium]